MHVELEEEKGNKCFSMGQLTGPPGFYTGHWWQYSLFNELLALLCVI